MIGWYRTSVGTQQVPGVLLATQGSLHSFLVIAVITRFVAENIALLLKSFITLQSPFSPSSFYFCSCVLAATLFGLLIISLMPSCIAYLPK